MQQHQYQQNGMSQQQQQMMMQMMWQQQMGMGNWPQQKGWGWGNQQQPQQPQQPSGCQGFADVVILLDSSGSIGEENFRKQLDFVSGVVSSFQLSSGQARSGYQFSVVSFSQAVKEEFNLNRYRTQQQLRDAIRAIPFMGENTDTHKALEFALRDAFRSDKGGRYGAVKIVVVITDGRSNMPTETENMANEVRKMGAMIVSIGIGNDVDPDELRKISASDSNVFRVENFDVLSTITDTVEKRTCDITIDQGGGVDGTRTGGGGGQWDMQDYMKWTMEQELMRKERESARKMLEALENAQKEEKERREKREHEREDMMHMEVMKEQFHEIVEMQEHMDKLSYHLMEMKHGFYFMVTSEMIKLCPLGERREEVRMLMMHGDSHWEPGKEENCDNEDMERVDENASALEVAQQLAGKSEVDKLEAFFGGLKDSVCGSLIAYMDKLEVDMQQNPNLRNWLTMM